MKRNRKGARLHHNKSRYAAKVREYRDARDRIVILILVLVALFFIYILL